MAQVDVQWPSEDEDFDATSDSVGGVPDFDEDDEADSKSGSAAPSEASVEPPKTESEPADEENESQPEPESDSEPESDVEPLSHDDLEPAPAEEKAPDPAPQHEVAPAEVPVAPAAQPSPKPPKVKKGSFGRTILEIILVAALIALGLWAWNLSSDNKNLKQQVSQLNNNPQVAVQKQTQSLIDNVSKLMQLPTGETPTVASVSDASQAKQQSAFFNNAQNGDKVLMYVKAGEAILYRPSTNKIILVAPLTFTSNSATSTPTPTPKATTR